MDVNVKVAVRCRPLSSKEENRGCTDIIQTLGKSLIVRPVPGSSNEEKMFTFDYVYNSDCTQLQVYQDLGAPVVTQALEGFNGTIFAYGQTGSGKTFSMMGTEENKGIIPQLNEDLWNRIGANLASNTNEDIQKKFFVTISFLEVYNEEIKDLLNPSDKKLKIHESPVEGIYIDNLSEIIVKDSHEVMKLIYQGNAIRHVGATLMNDQSSRSHSVFIIKVEQRISTKLSSGMQREQLIKAKLNLVDLAGSERVAKTQASGQTLKEGANINKSLLTLGNVINALAEGANKPGKKKVIPYRESKLTRLLQESLGGNSGTVMIASISPADYNYVETLSTLKYANRAKSIENAVVKNEDMSEKLIKDLQQEIEMLKKQLKEGGGGGDSTYEEELRLKLNEMKLHNDNIWEEKEKLSLELQSIRENNMNVLFSQIIPNMKNAKVTHMKNIKRLSNEKVLLLKNYKELKDDVSNLKSELDSNINSYQKLQVEFDENNRKSIENLEDEKEKEEKAQEYANQMIPLLQEIETKRPIYIEKKENLNRIKDRLKKIEEELIDERAELVSTSALLEQDDHIREQIQQEEREKLKKEIEEQIEIEKKNLKKDYLNEFEAQIENLTAELKLSKSLIEFEKSKAENLEEKFLNLKKYSEEVEEKLVDSEYEKEYYNEENEKKKKLLIELEEEKNKLLDDKNNLIKENTDLQEKVERLTLMLAKNNEESKSSKGNDEEARYSIFKACMDTFQAEREALLEKYRQQQQLLAQATRDLVHLTTRNQELENSLHQVIYNETKRY